jgi:hypothetical protein
MEIQLPSMAESRATANLSRLAQLARLGPDSSTVNPKWQAMLVLRESSNLNLSPQSTAAS